MRFVRDEEHYEKNYNKQLLSNNFSIPNLQLQQKKIIGQYEFFLSDKIGSGFSATVYLGKYINSNIETKLAVKVIDMNKIKAGIETTLL